MNTYILIFPKPSSSLPWHVIENILMSITHFIIDLNQSDGIAGADAVEIIVSLMMSLL